MKPHEEYRALRESLGLSRHKLGEMFGVRYPSIQKRELGQVDIPLAEMDTLRGMVQEKLNEFAQDYGNAPLPPEEAEERRRLRAAQDAL